MSTEAQGASHKRESVPISQNCALALYFIYLLTVIGALCHTQEYLTYTSANNIIIGRKQGSAQGQSYNHSQDADKSLDDFLTDQVSSVILR